ncbi:unnamed protein product [Nippostrongylus brasiliensis]|uniref:Secreted protein n=1 Tax=Nippostrongylus brasiliensis TaxID=27835 RepID=A0A0N4YUX9_NIPBR|nr:unnamed protein product [Nippostrongylus brasiliensis]
MRQLAGLLGLIILAVSAPDELHLTTNDEGYLTVIQGFAAQLNCALNTCSPNVSGRFSFLRRVSEEKAL